MAAIGRHAFALLACLIVLILAACGGRDTTPTPKATAAVSSSPTPSSPTPARVLSTQPEAPKVIYLNGTFIPETLQIAQGQTVEFVNRSLDPVWPASHIHPTHEIFPEFDPQRPLMPEESWRFTFDRAGEWRYHNHLDPMQTGRVIVTGDAPASTAATPSRGKVTFLPLGILSNTAIDPLFTDDEALLTFIREYGPAAAVAVLSDNQGRLSINCHPRAHDLGRMAYQEFGAQAFSLWGHECQSGSYHGATEAFFRDYGTTGLETNITLICSDSLNPFFTHQCVHGVGHGIMAWSSYALLDALASCDLLDRETNRLSCYSGVFMENVVGGLSGAMGHYTEYLSDDPHFPCDILEDRYVGPCYFYQTSRMVQLFGGDFQRVAQACDEAPEGIRYLCFESMGRDVGGATRGEPQRAIASCSYATTATNRRRCLSGAVQDSFWDSSGADTALSFCGALADSGDKQACYTTITRRARELPLNSADFERFCDRIEEGYKRPQDRLGALSEFPC